MAIVMVKFDGGNVPVVTGDIPPDDNTPISDPTPTGFSSNQAVIVADGINCFGLDTTIPYTPLWQTVQSIAGVQAEITFHRRMP
jgi:hypothetical protein